MRRQYRLMLGLSAFVILLFLTSCIPATQNEKGIMIKIVDEDGNILATDTYSTSSSLDTQSISKTLPEQRKTLRKYMRDAIRQANSENKNPTAQITYFIENTGNLPITVQVDAKVQGYYFTEGGQSG